MFGFLLLILALIISVNGILGDESATFTADELDERSAKDGDYIGCYDLGCLHVDYDVDGIDNMTTPDSCTATCKEHGFPTAGVYNRSKCSCSCEQTCIKQLDDDKCGLPCRPDQTKFCGGYTAVSVYTVRLSLTPSNTTCDTLEETKNITYEDPPLTSSLVRFAGTISIAVAIVVAGVLVTVMTKKCRELRINTERHRMSVQDNRVQERDDRVATGTYQPLGAMPKLPDIPQAGATAMASSGTEVKDGIYEEPDLGESSVPTACTVLAHEYLVLGQKVPSRSRSSDEYHEYNYPEIIQRRPMDPLRASRVGDNGYIAEPETQGLPSPGSKVYYSSRLPISQPKGETETSPTPTSKVYYSSRIPIPVHQGRSGSSRRSDTKPFSAHLSGPVHRDKLGVSTDPAAPTVYYSTRLRRSGNQSSELSPEQDNREDDGYIEVQEN